MHHVSWIMYHVKIKTSITHKQGSLQKVIAFWFITIFISTLRLIFLLIIIHHINFILVHWLGVLLMDFCCGLICCGVCGVIRYIIIKIMNNSIITGIIV